MRRHPFRALLVALAVVPALALPAGSAQASVTACASANVVPFQAAVSRARMVTLCLLNRERARHGMRPLRLNRRLSRAATVHSRDMVRRRYFAHGSLVGRILTFRYVTRRQAWALGENLAFGTGKLSSPAVTVRSWMHSPGHRANILNRRYRDIGIGIVVGAPTLPRADAATYTTDFGVKG